MFAKSDSMGLPKFSNAHSDPNLSSIASDEDFSMRKSCVSSTSPGTYDLPRGSNEGSPLTMSPWNQSTSPFTQSPWSSSDDCVTHAGLIGSLVREEGHIYSLAAKGDLLYTGSDSKNIRVWKDLNEFAAFKSNSGLVKAIVLSGNKIFSGHQDGKIRVWKVNTKNPSLYKRSGALPTLKAIFKASIRPSNYVEVRKKKSSLWIKHSDAISCLSLQQDQGLLYSASWDRTFKVWRISDSKCLESVSAHNDAVNSVVTSKDGFVFTGAADGSVKVWRREMQGKVTKHNFVQTLLDQETAVTALTISPSETVLYCGSSDGLVNFWEREKQLSHGGVLRGHKLAVLCLATVGNLVFSGSADKSICVWKRDGTVHTCLSVLNGHAGPVKCLAVEQEEEKFSGRSWKLYSGSLDKSVKVWSVSNQAIDYSQSDRMSQLAEPVWDSAPSEQSLS